MCRPAGARKNARRSRPCSASGRGPQPHGRESTGTPSATFTRLVNRFSATWDGLSDLAVVETGVAQRRHTSPAPTWPWCSTAASAKRSAAAVFGSRNRPSTPRSSPRRWRRPCGSASCARQGSNPRRCGWRSPPGTCWAWRRRRARGRPAGLAPGFRRRACARAGRPRPSRRSWGSRACPRCRKRSGGGSGCRRGHGWGEHAVGLAVK